MEYEIELKLLTGHNAGEIIENKLLPTLKSQVNKEMVTLTNHYFDTPNRLLRSHDMGLRIRTSNLYCEQTLKTSGQSIGGLHKRPEYNVSLDRANLNNTGLPDLSLFEITAWPEGFDFIAAQRNIETMFTTNFTRHIYLLEDDASCIEMVWDQGEVVSGNESVPICEIELELKKGDVNDLFNLAKQIASIMPLAIGVHSKAARGYKLADKIKISPPRLPDPCINSEKPFLKPDEYISLINEALAHFQLYTTFFLSDDKSVNLDDVAQISEALGLLRLSLDGLSKVTSCKKLYNLHEKSEKLLSQWLSAEINASNGEEKNFELGLWQSDFLTRPLAIIFQLELVQVMLEKPWLKHD